MYCDRSVTHFPGDTPISLSDGHGDEVRVGELLEDVGCTGDFKAHMNPSATPAKASVRRFCRSLHYFHICPFNKGKI